MNDNLLVKIGNSIAGLSKGHKKIAQYIIENYDKAAFMTASKLASTIGLSESTVVRFSTELGYEGYPDMQKALQEVIRNKLTSVQRIQVNDDRMKEADILHDIMSGDIEKIKRTIAINTIEEFNAAVDTILAAKRIYILGVRSSSALASFLGFYFNLIFDNIRLVHTTSVSEMFEQILRIDECDVVIGISFPRYSKRTFKAMQFAHDRNAKVIAITDSKLAPIAKYADHCLIAQSDMVSFVDSLVAPLSLINALIVAVGMRKKDEIYNIFEKLEHIWEEYQVYEKNETIN
jgi:DNA-binding MurR/RpiR family transcriptional regulator